MGTGAGGLAVGVHGWKLLQAAKAQGVVVRMRAATGGKRARVVREGAVCWHDALIRAGVRLKRESWGAHGVHHARERGIKSGVQVGAGWQQTAVGWGSLPHVVGGVSASWGLCHGPM